MSEYTNKRVTSADPGRGKRAGIIAWLIILLSFMTLYFAMLNPEEEYFNIYVILGLSLVFGIGGMAAFDIDIDLRFDSRQIRVLSEGILGGLFLVVVQIVASAVSAIVKAYMSSSSITFALMAPAPEELIFTMLVYGTLRAAMPDMPWFIAAVPASSIFALFHYWVYGVDVFLTPVLMTGGFVHEYLYERTGDIGTPMVSHLMVNSSPLMFSMALVWFEYWWVGLLVIVVYAAWVFLRR